ncbi:MAG: methyltransferase [Candidatus Thermoplasmatota archaeon]|nr:methyltransferase [Candidatus Thermoplasmatota archaeon]
MKQRQLEIILQQIPRTTNPIPHLEQYLTPATIAADIIFTAYNSGDIHEKTVVDLGCGTGIFAVGAYLMGAQKVEGYDIDPAVISLAKEYKTKNNYPIEFYIQDISQIETSCDTVLMNPPFGAQKANLKADRKFIEKGFEIASVIYSLHLKKTVPFIEKMITSLKGEIAFQKDYEFPIKWQFDFHYKEVVSYDVALLRIITHR